MKRILHFALLCISLNAFAQQSPIIDLPPGCFSDELRQHYMANDPAYQQRIQQMDNAILQRQLSGNPSVASLYYIPVVVHIIHNNGPENISNAQVMQGIQDLNDAFANTGAYLDPNGSDMQIRFCLAQQDEFGNATNGITRTVSTLTNETAETDDIALKNLIRWDPTKYLNIWLVKEITSLAAGPGVAGYAFLPASHGNPEDGIVNEAAYFGSDIHSSKVHIHEVGHYLGLYHTFEGNCTNNNCLVDGDRVCDTQPDGSSAAANCATPPNSCTTDDDDLSANNPYRPVANGGIGDQNDPLENYMDYGHQYCHTRFTIGQRDRMIDALTITRISLLSSIGCQSLCTSPINAGFTSSASVITTGGTVFFTNTSTGASTYAWMVNNSPIASTTNTSWTFPSQGYYVVTLTASNGDPSCTAEFSDTILVQCAAQASFNTSPAGPYLPGATLTFTNTSTGATTYTWYLDGVPQGSTTNFSQTFNNAGGHYVYLVSGNGNCSDTSTVNFFQIGQCSVTKMTDHWFLSGNQIDFTSGSPVVTANSAINSQYIETTSSISDVNGNLYFYSDGQTVWDRNNNVMPNGTGLMGHQSATQCVYITPDPGNSNRFYVFTNDAVETQFANGLRYSIVDMTLNGGLGDVTATKNVLLTNDAGERVSATWHSNMNDIWICTRSINGNSYYAYLLSSTGLSTTPVTSNIGALDGGGFGAMKFSHDGLRMACSIVSGPPRYVTVADFNPATGVFSNPIDLPVNNASWEQPYDVIFSPDNSKLYASLVNYGQVYQWDLSAGSPSAIIASKIAVDATAGISTFAHMALARDGKIYVKGLYNTALDVINSPNLAGAACNYAMNALPILPNASSWCLPNQFEGLLRPLTPHISGPTSACANQPTLFTISGGVVSDSAAWSVHGSGQLSSPSSTGVTLVNTIPGSYDTLILVYYGSCGVTSDSIIVHTNPSPIADLGNDTALCTSPMILSPGSGFAMYHWQNNSSAPSFSATATGTYWVEVTNGWGCTDTDSITLTAAPNIPPLNLGNDITVCLGHVATLQPSSAYANYTWQDGSHNPTFTAYNAGIYWLTVTDVCYTATDSVHVFMDESSIPLDLGPEIILCASAFPYTLNAPSGYPNYTWQDGSTASSFTATTFGQYWVTVTDANGCSAQDTIEIFNCVGIATTNAQNEISIYPNPVNESFTVTLPGNAHGMILLLNSVGEVVVEKQLQENVTQQTVQTSALAEGVYIVEIRNGESKIYSKIVIVH